MGISTEPGRLRRKMLDLPLGWKLFCGFSSTMLVLALVVVCLFLTVARLGAAKGSIVEVAEEHSQSSDQLRFAAADLRATQQAYVLAETPTHDEFDRAARRFETALETLRNTADTPVDDALLNKIATAYETFMQTDQTIWGAIQQSNFALAHNLTLGAESIAFAAISEDAGRLVDRADDQRRAASAAFDHTSDDARLLVVALGAVALVLMVAANIDIARLICGPLYRVQRAAERAADGDLTAEATVVGNDETGRLARAFNTMMAKLRQREEAMIKDHGRQATDAQIRRALEMSDDEDSALAVVGRAFEALVPGRSVELLLADNSKASMEQAAVAGPLQSGQCCPVASPFSCVAVRTGAPITFPSSGALDACPHLVDGSAEPHSAACVPVTFMGRAIGVIHMVGPDHQPPSTSEVDSVSTLSALAGARVGLLRTMVRTAVQASTDSLTGLMNRRSFQNRARALRRSGTPFSLVMADIDHFKRLNDTYGHETGDRALTTFSAVITRSLRQGDVVARWGGEEFAFAFTGDDTADAVRVLGRIRSELATQLATSDIPTFTVSFGVVAADQCGSLEEAIRLADNALYEAKAAGRDQSIVAATPSTDAARPTRIHESERPIDPRVGVLAGIANQGTYHDDADGDL